MRANRIDHRTLKREAWPRPLRVLHGVIIVNYLLNIGYAAYEVFFVLRPEGVKPGMPLGAAAEDVDPTMMEQRRGYAAEAWLSIVGLTTYLAVTEYLPRILRAMLTPDDD